MNDKNMISSNDFESTGEWWLPEDPGITVSGIINFNQKEGGKLELIGSFEKVVDDLPSLKPRDIILGFSTEGKKITLWRCYNTGSSITQSGLSTTQFHVQFIFVGHHFPTQEDIYFNEILIEYSNINEWVTTRIPKSKIHNFKDHQSIEIKYNYPPVSSIVLNNFSIILLQDYYSRFSSDEMIFKEKTFFIIKTNQNTSIEIFIYTYNYHLQNLLSLLRGKPISTNKVIGRTESAFLESPKGDRIATDIEIYFRFRNAPLDLVTNTHPHDYVISFFEFQKNMEESIKCWFEKAELLRPVYDLYFSIIFNPYMYLQNQFLSLTQALESYHRRIYGGKYLEDDKYKLIEKEIIAAIPKETIDDLKQSLLTKIKYGNEFSLRKRLNEILDNCIVYYELPCSIDEFVNDVITTRNYLVHYEESERKKAKDDEELFELVLILKIIVEICLLIELKIPNNIIKTAIKRRERYYRV